jgi:hypothetical protein
LTQLLLRLIVRPVDGTIGQRAAVHAALGEPLRLAIVEDPPCATCSERDEAELNGAHDITPPR